MHTTHIIVGANSAKILEETIAIEEALAGKIVILTDDYHLGHLHSEANHDFDEMRQAYWASLGKVFAEGHVSDQSKINDLIAKVLNKEEMEDLDIITQEAVTENEVVSDDKEDEDEDEDENDEDVEEDDVEDNNKEEIQIENDGENDGNENQNESTDNNTETEDKLASADKKAAIKKVKKSKTKEVEALGPRVIFWMAPNAQDVCAYYWLLNYFQKHAGLLHVISIDSLPFFNEKGILYYPKHFAQLLPKEMAKCKHLIKELSPSDYEVDMDEWVRLASENGMVRSHDVGKKVSTRNESHMDGAIYLSITSNFVKAHKVLATVMNKGGSQANETFMAYRLRKLVEQGSFVVQGDTTKALKDFEIKSNKKVAEESEAETPS